MAAGHISLSLLLGFLFSCGALSSAVDDTGALVQVNLQRGDQPNRTNPAVPVVKSGQTFYGALHCSFGDVGMRMEVTEFPKTAEVHLWPSPRVDLDAGRWCHPLASCQVTFSMEGSSYDGNWFTFTPGPDAERTMKSKCNWLTFNINGYSSGYLTEPILNGNVDPPVKFGAEDDAAHDGRRSFGCHAENDYIKNHGYPVECSTFELRMCTGRSPESREKLIYAIDSIGSLHVGFEDVGQVVGKNKAKSLRHHPLFADMFGPNRTRPVTKVYCAPAARAFETAAVAFGRAPGAKIILDKNLIDYHAEVNKTDFLESLHQVTDAGFMFGDVAVEILGQYNVIYGGMASDAAAKKSIASLSERTASFRDKLFAESDERVIVVAHRNFMHSSDDVPVPDELVRPYILNFARELEHYEPSCWETM